MSVLSCDRLPASISCSLVCSPAEYGLNRLPNARELDGVVSLGVLSKIGDDVVGGM